MHALAKWQLENLAQLMQKIFPPGAARACALLAEVAIRATGCPVTVDSAVQSPGKWSAPPHRKHCSLAFFFCGCWDGEEDGGDGLLSCAWLYDAVMAGCLATMRVAMMVSALSSSWDRSCCGCCATISRCWMSYSTATSHEWERLKPRTTLW
jgi:hypothetical protein